MTQENKVAIPQDVKDKIKERFKLNPDCDPSIRSEHFLAKEFSKDGAEFGYGLAAENLAAKEKEIAKLKEENFQLSAEITSVSDGYDRVELQQEIERLEKSEAGWKAAFEILEYLIKKKAESQEEFRRFCNTLTKEIQNNL